MIGLALLPICIVQYHKNIKLRRMNLIVGLTYISMIASIVCPLKSIYSLSVKADSIRSCVLDSERPSSLHLLVLNGFQILVCPQYAGNLCHADHYFAGPCQLVFSWSCRLKNMREIFKVFSKEDDISPEERQKMEAAIRFYEHTTNITIVYAIIRIVSLTVFLILFIAINNEQTISHLALA